MKGKNKIFRLICSPFILAIFILGYNFKAVTNWLCFLRYGGELITHTKDDRASIDEIYRKLKDIEINKQTTN